MNEPPGARLRVGLTGLTVASTSATWKARTSWSSSTTSSGSRRRAPRCRRCSGGCRRPWAISRPSLRRWASYRSGSPPPRRLVTSVQAIYVRPTTSPIRRPATAFSHLDATVVLSRQIFELGIYPPWIRSRRRRAFWMLQYLGERHYKVAVEVQRICNATRTCRTSSRSWDGRAVRGRQTAGGACPPGAALPVAAVLSSPPSSRASRANT